LAAVIAKILGAWISIITIHSSTTHTYTRAAGVVGGTIVLIVAGQSVGGENAAEEWIAAVVGTVITVIAEQGGGSCGTDSIRTDVIKAA
tara:strand:- start:552 stop:818 length:267 start_codon:yes stop_codon:yes gene_type:complete